MLYDVNRKIRQAFVLRLSSDENGKNGLGRKKLVIFIEKARRTGVVTFPLPPQLVSLEEYDDVTKASGELAQGYPAICVTVRTSSIWPFSHRNNQAFISHHYIHIFVCLFVFSLNKILICSCSHRLHFLLSILSFIQSFVL